MVNKYKETSFYLTYKQEFRGDWMVTIDYDKGMVCCHLGYRIGLIGLMPNIRLY